MEVWRVWLAGRFANRPYGLVGRGECLWRVRVLLRRGVGGGLVRQV